VDRSHAGRFSCSLNGGTVELDDHGVKTDDPNIVSFAVIESLLVLVGTVSLPDGGTVEMVCSTHDHGREAFDLEILAVNDESPDWHTPVGPVGRAPDPAADPERERERESPEASPFTMSMMPARSL
jgi:hypothetical protein